MHIKHIHCMIEDLAEYGKCMIEAGVGNGDVKIHEAGQIVDMIKDLADAEYHSLISKEMKKYEEEEEEEKKYLLRMLKEEHKDDYKRYMEEYGDDGERRFYDEWRYKSTGRYAPKGRGTRVGRRGYVEPPYYHMMPDGILPDYDGAERGRDVDRMTLGRMYYTEPVYHDGKTADMSKTNVMHDMKPESRFDKAKRGYTEAKEIHKGSTPEDKQITMREAEKFTNIAIDELMEALEDASPEVKNMVKTKVMSKMQKM